MFVCFKRELQVIDNITIDNFPIERVSTYKLFGVNLSSNLKWNYDNQETAKRIYSVRLLKRAGDPATDLVPFYSTCIESVLEYTRALHGFTVLLNILEHKWNPFNEGLCE